MFFSNPTLLEYTMATLKNLLSHNQFMSQPLLRSQVCIVYILVSYHHVCLCVGVVYHGYCVVCGGY